MRQLIALFLMVVAGCGDSDRVRVPRDAPPAAAIVRPGLETVALSTQLRELEAELARSAEGEAGSLLRAEAITDRLIHAERPVDWLASGYDVEARLRQLQAMADRTVARLRRGASLDAVAEELTAMRTVVEELQRQLAMEGGGPAPPSLDSLLAQDPLRDVQAAALSRVVAARDSAEAAREPLLDIEPEVKPVQSRAPDQPRPSSLDTIPGR